VFDEITAPYCAGILTMLSFDELITFLILF
jgi:hypothetical protein